MGVWLRKICHILVGMSSKAKGGGWGEVRSGGGG